MEYRNLGRSSVKFSALCLGCMNFGRREGGGECSNEGVDGMTKIHTDAHPTTPIIAMMTGHKMTAGIRAGTGWRCDSCDDLGLWGDPNADRHWRFNHLFDCYPENVVRCGAQDAWKAAPFAFEPGKTARVAFDLGFDLDFVIQQDLKYHGSLISWKSYELPEPWMDKLLKFANDLGYRFVLRQATIEVSDDVPRKVDFHCWIENVGVAPIYRRYDFAFRLTQGSKVHIHRAEADITKWLPGDAWVDETVTIPDDFERGSLMVHAGPIDRDSEEVKVRFASEGTGDDGWLALGAFEMA